MSYNFKTQLNIGEEGENHFKLDFTQFNPVKSLNRAWDFNITYDNVLKKVELKTETRSLEQTSNFFIEYHSDTNDLSKRGGPYRALQDKIDVFIFYFIKNRTYYIFKDIQKLVDCCEQYRATNNCKLIEVRSNSWSIRGYVIPRSQLQHLFCELKIT